MAEKKKSFVAVAACGTAAAVSVITGFIFNSCGLFGIGLLFLLCAVGVFPFSSPAARKVWHIAVAALACVGCVYSFFKSMLTVGYADQSVSIYAVVALAVLFLAGVGFTAFFDGICAEYDFAMIIFCILCCILAVILTFAGLDFYIETAVGSAVCATVVYRIVSVIKVGRGG